MIFFKSVVVSAVFLLCLLSVSKFDEVSFKYVGDKSFFRFYALRKKVQWLILESSV